MKRALGWCATWLLYWFGDFLSLVIGLGSHEIYGKYFYWLYPVYNRCMGWSYRIQEWAGSDGPWQEPKP